MVGSGGGPGCLTAPLRHARQGVPPFAGAAGSPGARVPTRAAQASSPSTVVLRTRPDLGQQLQAAVRA